MIQKSDLPTGRSNDSAAADTQAFVSNVSGKRAGPVAEAPIHERRARRPDLQTVPWRVLCGMGKGREVGRRRTRREGRKVSSIVDVHRPERS